MWRGGDEGSKIEMIWTSNKRSDGEQVSDIREFQI